MRIVLEVNGAQGFTPSHMAKLLKQSLIVAISVRRMGKDPLTSEGRQQIIRKVESEISVEVP